MSPPLIDDWLVVIVTVPGSMIVFEVSAASNVPENVKEDAPLPSLPSVTI